MLQPGFVSSAECVAGVLLNLLDESAVPGLGTQKLGGMAMDLKDIVKKHGLPLDKVVVVRHKPKEKELLKVLPWLVGERHDLFNAFQSFQAKQVEASIKKARYIASFITHGSGTALFVGFYERCGEQEITESDFFAIREISEMVEKFGIKGFDSRPTALRFDLQLLDACRDWSGRLVIGWPPDRAWCRWLANAEFPMVALYEESRLVIGIPSWQELVLSWQQLQALPASWRTKLGEWRGVYFIFDTSDRKGYVGSAYGVDNIYGRWENYAHNGHGGNQLLRDRDPRNFVYSILQRTSPDAPDDEVIALESAWKRRLHTREHGLNAN